MIINDKILKGLYGGVRNNKHLLENHVCQMCSKHMLYRQKTKLSPCELWAAISPMRDKNPFNLLVYKPQKQNIWMTSNAYEIDLNSYQQKLSIWQFVIRHLPYSQIFWISMSVSQKMLFSNKYDGLILRKTFCPCLTVLHDSLNSRLNLSRCPHSALHNWNVFVDKHLLWNAFVMRMNTGSTELKFPS